MTEFTVPSRADGHCEDDAAWSEMVRRYGPMDRSRLCMGEKSDFLLANAQFLVDRNSLDLIAYQTAAKDRIRWLSIQLAIARGNLAFPSQIDVWPRDEQHRDPDPVAHTLSLASQPWTLMAIAHRLQAAGHPIPKRAEAEYAAALHFLLTHVLKDPQTGLQAAAAELGDDPCKAGAAS